jgi:RimJ/RimL family protein N-acetyltransferase
MTTYTIKKIGMEHAEQRFKAIKSSLSHLMPWFPWAHPEYTLSESNACIIDAQKNWDLDKDYNFAIIQRLSGEYIGEIKIMDVKRDYA